MLNSYPTRLITLFTLSRFEQIPVCRSQRHADWNEWSYRVLFFFFLLSTLQPIEPIREGKFLKPSSCASLTPTSFSLFPLDHHCSLLHLPFPRNQQAQPPLRLQKPASLSASATPPQRLVLHAFLTSLLSHVPCWTHTFRHILTLICSAFPSFFCSIAL